MIKGAAVKEYFEKHPEAVQMLDGVMYQFRLPGDSDEPTHRPLTIDDIRYITFEDIEGNPGVFAWFYPCGVPHYISIEGSTTA